MSTVGFQERINSYVVYFDNSSIAKYSVNKYGVQAKLVAELSAKLNKRIKNFYRHEGDTTILYYYYKLEDRIAEIKIDRDDFELIQDFFWSIKKDKYTYYVSTFMSRHEQIKLHRFIMNTPKDKMVDHIDKNGLNNCKINLRNVNNSTNQKNIKVTTRNSTGYNGVHYKIEKGNHVGYIAMWNINGKRHKKSFSINKYGTDKALELAIQTRKEMEKIYGYL